MAIEEEETENLHDTHTTTGLGDVGVGEGKLAGGEEPEGNVKEEEDEEEGDRRAEGAEEEDEGDDTGWGVSD